VAQERRPIVSAFGLSLTAHAVLAALLLMYMGVAPEPVTTKAVPVPTNLVFIQQAGPGGGGGGRRTAAAPAQIEIPRAAPITATSVPDLPVDPPPPTISAPVTTFDAHVLKGGGLTLGAAPGPGGRGGPGRGLGDGDGDGVGPGKDKGLGDGPYGPGAATEPTLRLQVRPEYTSAALAAKMQGIVTLEVEVLPDGTVGTVRVLKSLDRVYGLDQSAIAAAKKWRFFPGTVNGKPVPTIVTLILEFNLR
jgi:protein TonB